MKDGERGEGFRAEAPVPRSDVSFRLNQKTAVFNVAIDGRPIKWSVLTEENQKNQLAQSWTFDSYQTTMIQGAGAVTCGLSPAHPRCAAKANGRVQRGH